MKTIIKDQSKIAVFLQGLLIYSWLTVLSVLSVTDTYYTVYLLCLSIESVRCFLLLLETDIYLAVFVLDTIDIYKIKNRWYKTIGFCVSTDLFFRAVASQVFSAQLSLTSVFGMGTGGPSTLVTLTFWCTFRDSNPGPTD